MCHLLLVHVDIRRGMVSVDIGTGLRGLRGNGMTLG